MTPPLAALLGFALWTVFLVQLLVAVRVGTRTELFTWLPAAVLALRLLQSSAHLASGSAAAATFRFSCFALQLVGLLVLSVEVLRTSS